MAAAPAADPGAPRTTYLRAIDALLRAPDAASAAGRAALDAALSVRPA